MNELILAKALRHFGHQKQAQKCLEELAELSVALHHHLDDKAEPHTVATEVADVMIMAAQMRLMLGKNLVDGFIQAKMARLEERMA